MAREMYLAGVDPEDLKPTPKAEPPKTFKEKWANYWYHYKWLTIGCLAGVIVLVILIVQMVTVDRPDYTLLLVTNKAYMPQQTEALERFLEQYGEDIDGDGKVEVEILECYLNKADTQTYYANSQMMQVHLMAGDVMLYAYEPELYEQFMSTDAMKEAQFFTPLGTDADGLAEDGTYWNWKDDPRITGDEVLSAFPEELYFGVRQSTGTAKDSVDMHDQGMRLLQALMTNQPTAQ